MATDIIPATVWDADRFLPNMLLDEKLEHQKMRIDTRKIIRLTIKASTKAFAMLFDEQVCGLAGVRPDKGLPDGAGLFWLYAGQAAQTQMPIFKRELRKVAEKLVLEYDPLVQMFPVTHPGLGWWGEMGWKFGDSIGRPAGPPVVPVYFTKKDETFGRSGKVDFAAEAAREAPGKKLVIQ